MRLRAEPGGSALAALSAVRVEFVRCAGAAAVLPEAGSERNVVARVVPCWVVVVRHHRESGRLGAFSSRPLRLAEARQLLGRYQATGTPARMTCVEELAELHRRHIRGELDWDDVLRHAHDLGYEVA